MRAKQSLLLTIIFVKEFGTDDPDPFVFRKVEMVGITRYNEICLGGKREFKEAVVWFVFYHIQFNAWLKKLGNQSKFWQQNSGVRVEIMKSGELWPH